MLHLVFEKCSEIAPWQLAEAIQRGRDVCVNIRPRVYRVELNITLDSGIPVAEAVAILDGRVFRSDFYAAVTADLVGAVFEN